MIGVSKWDRISASQLWQTAINQECRYKELAEENKGDVSTANMYKKLAKKERAYARSVIELVSRFTDF